MREELEPEALAQGSLAAAPLLTLTLTVARGSVPSSCGFTGGPGGWAEALRASRALGASRHQPVQKEGPFGKEGGQGGLRAGKASGASEEDGHHQTRGCRRPGSAGLAGLRASVVFAVQSAWALLFHFQIFSFLLLIAT